MLVYAFFCNIIKFKRFCTVLLFIILICTVLLFIILLHLISTFLHTKSLLVPFVYVFIESIDCFLLSSSKRKAILKIFLV